MLYEVITQAGGWLLLFVMALVWCADSGAYFTGRAFGRRKMLVITSYSIHYTKLYEDAARRGHSRRLPPAPAGAGYAGPGAPNDSYNFV